MKVCNYSSIQPQIQQASTKNNSCADNRMCQYTDTQTGINTLGIYNKSLVNFKGYHGDPEPSKRLFWILTGRNHIYRDDYTDQHTYNTGTNKKWVTSNPEDLLKRTPEQAIQSICTLNNSLDIPGLILPPNYGDKWGRRANYIEINPRTIAQVKGDQVEEGLLNTIKLLPAIPPSSKSIANCVILSELYPPIWNDGHTGKSSLYTVNLHEGISKSLLSNNLCRDGQWMKPEEQVKAFNDLAHLRGLKTGIRMPLSAGQMRVHGKDFNWYEHQDAYISACCWAIELGFDSIFFDSAKHVGWYDMDNYYGYGDLPNFQQMQYITQQIRYKTGRNDIAFIGEKCTNDGRFKEMGLNAGTDWGKADNYGSVEHEYKQQHGCDEYAAGPIVSDDNDNGAMTFEQRRHRFGNAINAQHGDIGYKLPVFLQMHDLFPLTPSTNTHNEMENSYGRTAYGDLESHYNNIFNTSDAAKHHRFEMYHLFLDNIDK